MLIKVVNRLLKPVGYQLYRGSHAADGMSFQAYFNATQGMTSFDEASLLYRLAKDRTEGCIVEVGSYRGRSTVALGRGSLDGHRTPVFAIEPHEEFVGILGGRFGPEDRAAFFRAMLDTACYQIVRLVNLSSEIVAPNWTKPVSLLWIDGDHTYHGVKRDFECWEPHLTKDALLAFDDSLDTAIGPYQLINELLAGGKYQRTELVGKISVLKRVT